MLNRVNLITRLSILLAVNILALSFDKVQNLIYLTLFSLFVWALSRPNLERVKFTAMIVIPVIWSFVLMQGLFYSAEPKTVLLVLVPPNFPIIGWLTGGLYIIYQGLIYGLVQSLRMVSVLMVGMAIAWSTSESEVFKTLMNYFKNIKLAVATGIAIKFLDTFITEVKTLNVVSQVHFREKFPRKLIRIVYVLSAQMLRRCYTITLALLSRGISGIEKIRAKEQKLTVVDKIIITCALSLALTVAVLKILTVLFLYGILYVPSLGYLYKWVLNNL